MFYIQACNPLLNLDLPFQIYPATAGFWYLSTFHNYLVVLYNGLK